MCKILKWIIFTFWMIFIFFFIPIVLQAQEEDDIKPAPEVEIPGYVERYLRLDGDLLVTFGAGVLLPAYTHMFNFKDFRGIRLNPGGDFYIGLSGYFSSHLRMGASIEFGVAKGVNETLSYFLPITFNAIYDFRISSLSFPVGGEIGIIIGSYRELLAVNLILKGNVGTFWNFTRQWAIGVNFSYWIVPQIVWRDMEKSRVGGLFSATLCGQYYF